MMDFPTPDRGDALDSEIEWVFGYGSLIWRPAFEYSETRVAWIDGWTRRFWQGSPDHRGTPERPGRVVTLVPAEGARCWGRAFRLSASGRAAILAQLDVREQGGYDRCVARLGWPSRDASPEAGPCAVFWVASERNSHYLGPASPEEIARHVIRSRGPSGENLEYLLELHRALEGMAAGDEHVAQVAEAARQLVAGQEPPDTARGA